MQRRRESVFRIQTEPFIKAGYRTQDKAGNKQTAIQQKTEINGELKDMRGNERSRNKWRTKHS